ncbi:MAG: 16S rRNA (cytosine(1402)-N(4))-methyltransferase RsmH [Methylotenera sp.]|nr:16S rRNA (cytosine(1402)-N(4))-methyltransferase RsmH [Oligoflexia bacterium]
MTVHVPILVEPIVQAMIEALQALPEGTPPHWVVDCTFGGGGHTDAFLKAIAAEPKIAHHKVLGVDQDESAVSRGHERFAKEISGDRLKIVHRRFSELSEEDLAGRSVAYLLADLGFSSDQLEDSERGLSFQSNGPLDMRLDPSRGVSCRDYLFNVTEQELVEILQNLGEERFSRRIAHAIISKRRESAMPKTTRELADLIVHSVPPEARRGRIHAATRTFQALRIVVNQELEELDKLLSRVILFVRPGGRVAIISFHSLEDRKVKQTFKGESDFEQLTKKPIEADEVEVSRNPRSRSAKLRIAERTIPGEPIRKSERKRMGKFS